jgi:hypothetical protein
MDNLIISYQILLNLSRNIDRPCYPSILDLYIFVSSIAASPLPSSLVWLAPVPIYLVSIRPPAWSYFAPAMLMHMEVCLWGTSPVSMVVMS